MDKSKIIKIPDKFDVEANPQYYPKTEPEKKCPYCGSEDGITATFKLKEIQYNNYSIKKENNIGFFKWHFKEKKRKCKVRRCTKCGAIWRGDTIQDTKDEKQRAKAKNMVFVAEFALTVTSMFIFSSICKLDLSASIIFTWTINMCFLLITLEIFD